VQLLHVCDVSLVHHLLILLLRNMWYLRSVVRGQTAGLVHRILLVVIDFLHLVVIDYASSSMMDLLWILHLLWHVITVWDLILIWMIAAAYQWCLCNRPVANNLNWLIGGLEELLVLIQILSLQLVLLSFLILLLLLLSSIVSIVNLLLLLSITSRHFVISIHLVILLRYFMIAVVGTCLRKLMTLRF